VTREIHYLWRGCMCQFYLNIFRLFVQSLYFSCIQMIISHNNITSFIHVFSLPSKETCMNMFLFLILQETDIIRWSAGKQFEVISVCEMKLRCSWWFNK